MDKSLNIIRKQYIDLLKLSEKQFQLMISVRLACTLGIQPLIVPDLWTYGKNRLEGHEIQLNLESADEAAAFLEHTVIHSWSIYIWDAINKMIVDPANHKDANIIAAFQICRLIRNAYSHHPYSPKWDNDCLNNTYEIADVISLNTNNQAEMKWQHYGGLISLWKLSHWIRVHVLKDEEEISADKAYSPSGITQQGRMIIQRNNQIPSDAKKLPLNIKEIAGKRYAIIGSDSDGEYKIELNEEMNNVEIYKTKYKVYIRVVN